MEKKIMFPFNNLSGSSKPNATVTGSTNLPSRSNLNTDDTAVKSGDKSHLNTDCTASGSQSDSNSSLFVFGKQSLKKDSDFKNSEGFNFVFNSNSFDPSLFNSNIDSKVDESSSVKFSMMNNLFDNKEKMDSKLEDKTRAELDSDNNNENLNENSNENSVKDEKLNNQEQRTDENASNEESMKIIVEEFKNATSSFVKEFKDVIRSFVKERIDGEKKIAALEARITTLEVQNLKTTDSKESSRTSSANYNKDKAKSTVNSVSQQPLEEPPAIVSHQTPSPLVLSPAESSTLKKCAFGSTSSLFGSSSAPFFNGTSTNTFGSVASSVLGNDSTTSSNFVLGTSAFKPCASTKIAGGSQLFGSTTQVSNQNGKSLAPERKKVQKLFSPEAVTEFLNAQKEPTMSNLAKILTGQPLIKIANGQENLEQNQNVPTKEAFELHLQRTIEMSVKNAMEEYWEHFKPNTSENNIKKFNSGNMF